MKIIQILLLIPVLSFSQNGQIALEDIYKSGRFQPSLIAGFHSMKDGKYYVEKSSEGIVKKDFLE